jgi:hypothetical protein
MGEMDERMDRRVGDSRSLGRIVLARRQSPDWDALAADYRAGRPIDPRRFIPHRSIPGFPAEIERIIAAWNRRFRIDFFSCRAYIVAVARQALAHVENAAHVAYDDLHALSELAEQSRFIVFFHDDDDFFAPDCYARLAAHGVPAYDVSVFPLPRVHHDVFTFVRDGADAETIWGRRKSFDFRFQTNNYGIDSRIGTPELWRGMKDHVEASAYATAHGLTEGVYAFPVSATVKTPCSASMLHGLLENGRAYRKTIGAFAERFAHPDPPPALRWLTAPLQSIGTLLGAVAANHGYDRLPQHGVPHARPAQRS